MSGFGEWRAYVGREDYGHDLALHIGREIAPNEHHVITAIDADGPLVETKAQIEGTIPHIGIRIPLEVGAVLYEALHRVFGQENPDGQVKALQEALNVERTRVNAFLQVGINSQAQPTHQVT